MLFCFLKLFVTYFVHNVAATVSYDRKELLDIRTGITHLKLELFFNESDASDILQTPDQAPIPVIPPEKETEISRQKIRVPCEDQATSG